MMLSEQVSVAPRFKRSVRVDTDISTPSSLAGFVCNASTELALSTMVRGILDYEQRAFTWTGPYGGGKSTLALVLASYLGGSARFSKLASDCLKDVTGLREALPRSKEPWLILPVTGRRSDPAEDISETLFSLPQDAFVAPRTSKIKNDAAGRSLIDALVNEAVARKKSGVLIVLDEMGKFLEGVADKGTDVHFFQELAEAATRCKGRLIVVGVLHQSFEQYASRLGRESRDEWAKVQGRFLDIPLVTGVDEVVDLLGQAIVAEDIPHEHEKIATQVAGLVKGRRPSSPSDLEERLSRCWPLHPVTALLLGPVSRRGFGQNERSTFAFLNSSEPFGFQEFLMSTPDGSDRLYDPDALWEYLQVNLEPAILASPDGHRWSQGVEGIERAEARGDALHVRIAKTIAVIDLFRGGSGLVAEPKIVETCLNDVSKKAVRKALGDLESWSVVVYRKHIGAWSLYAGSDFDIEEAIEEVSAQRETLDLSALNASSGLQSLVAKRHYHQTGTLRWFETDLQPFANLDAIANSSSLAAGAAGKFVLVVPGSDDTKLKAQRAILAASKQSSVPTVFGIATNSYLLRDRASDLLALEVVQKTRPELEGDAVARREINARISTTQAEFEEQLRHSVSNADWYFRGERVHSSAGMGVTRLVSSIADSIFSKAPIIHSELVNRDKPSSSAQAALRLLMYAMVEKRELENLGIEGYPAERGLYESVLKNVGLHRNISRSKWGFFAPDENGSVVQSSFAPMWATAHELINETDGPISLRDIYQLWTSEPFGVRAGILPLLGLALILEQADALAVYSEEIFVPEIDNFFVDLLLQDPKNIGLRKIRPTQGNKRLLDEFRNAANTVTMNNVPAEPLAIARALVGFTFRLPNWTRKTTKLSKQAIKVRGILLTANDPYRALFEDIPGALNMGKKSKLKLLGVIEELDQAYPKMLKTLFDQMIKSLGHHGKSLRTLQQRAQSIAGIAGDLRLDAFASRISTLSDPANEVEGIASLVLNKPPRDWSDHDTDRAALGIAELAQSFVQAEMFAGVRGRETNQHAVAIAFGKGGNAESTIETFSVSDDEREALDAISNDLNDVLKRSKADRRLMLAALAELGISIISTTETPKKTKPKKRAS